MADLRSSLGFVLKENGVHAHVWSLGKSLVVEGAEPMGAAALVDHMPGIAWIAAGETVGSDRELAVASGEIARKFLRKGGKFRVKAEGTGRVAGADLSGMVTSGILDGVKGARVSEDGARVTFRAAFDGSKGVVGVEVREGPGGVPTGRNAAVCLVSGGMHSSVLAWMAALVGYRVHLVHAKVDEESLRAVARLYSELSHRADPRSLGLEVLEGDCAVESLAKFASGADDPVFGGFSGEGGELPERLFGIVQAPLYLMPEEMFEAEFRSLAIKEYRFRTDWKAKGNGTYTARRFGGVMSDVSGVLDGL